MLDTNVSKRRAGEILKTQKFAISFIIFLNVKISVTMGNEHLICSMVILDIIREGMVIQILFIYGLVHIPYNVKNVKKFLVFYHKIKARTPFPPYICFGQVEKSVIKLDLNLIYSTSSDIKLTILNKRDIENPIFHMPRKTICVGSWNWLGPPTP